MNDTTRKLLDLGESLGADPVAYIRARILFEDFAVIAESGSYQAEAAQILLNALNTMHMAVCGKTEDT